jgi:FixJ family two-component response regulator
MSKGPTLLKDLGWEGEELKQSRKYRNYVPLYTTKEISDILCVSPSTIKTHRANIMEKLQIDNISQLIQFAIRLGIVDIQ